jgi:hypothetical protein
MGTRQAGHFLAFRSIHSFDSASSALLFIGSLGKEKLVSQQGQPARMGSFMIRRYCSENSLILEQIATRRGSKMANPKHARPDLSKDERTTKREKMKTELKLMMGISSSSAAVTLLRKPSQASSLRTRYCISKQLEVTNPPPRSSPAVAATTAFVESGEDGGVVCRF